MKLLHIIDDMSYGGAQSLLSDLACVQKNVGIDVAVLVLKACDSGFVSKLKNAGISIISLSEGSVYNPFLIFKIGKYIRNYNIVHVHLFPAQYWVAFAKIMYGLKIPLITTEHSTHNGRRNHPILKYVDRWIYCHSYQYIACCSDKALDTFHTDFPVASAVSIPNGIDVERFLTAEPMDKTDIVGVSDSFLITMVARFQYPKRQDVLIEALCYLPSNAHVVLVGGEGPNKQMARCKKLAQSLGVSDKVHFLGIRDDVPSILKTSDVIVLSSEYEGLSLSSVEGMAAGHPFVATDANGLREVVNNAGVLFPNGDSRQLASIINHLYRDKVTRNAIAEQCRQRALDYDIRKMERSYFKLYENTLKITMRTYL